MGLFYFTAPVTFKVMQPLVDFQAFLLNFPLRGSLFQFDLFTGHFIHVVHHCNFRSVAPYYFFIEVLFSHNTYL